MRRRDMCKGLLGAGAALITAPALRRSAFADEAGSIVIISQHGLPYLPLMMMEAHNLVETHAAKAGLPNLKPEYRTMGGTQSLVDALLSGQMNFGVTGVPGLAQLWDKTAGTANEVRALSAVQSMPFLLISNRPEVKTIRDFSEHDKIAVPGVKNSNQAICLQMAAAKEWGQDHYARLDPLTINRPHPDATAAMLSKSTEITGHYGVAPFQNYEVAAGLNVVVKSYDSLGGKTTNGVMLMTRKFRDANPKTTAAVYAALVEAEEMIVKSPAQSAEVYIKKTSDKRSTVAEMAAMIADPDNVWTTTPQNAMAYTHFMNKIGTLKRTPQSWKDLFMPECHDTQGS